MAEAEEVDVEEEEVKEEEPLGILLYGFDGKESSYLQSFLADVMGQYVIPLSASGQEETPIQGILKSPSKSYEEKDTKILMFLGFNDEQIGKVLNEFPRDGSIHRPIFCALTQENIKWPLKQLIEHLGVEDRHWKNRGTSVTTKAPDSYEDKTS